MNDAGPVGVFVRTEGLTRLRAWMPIRELRLALRDSPDGATTADMARLLFLQLGMAALPSTRTPEIDAWAKELAESLRPVPVG